MNVDKTVLIFFLKMLNFKSIPGLNGLRAVNFYTPNGASMFKQSDACNYFIYFYNLIL